MYGTLRKIAITLLIFIGLAQPLFAGLAEDQYATAAHHYGNARWQMAVDEFTQFLDEFPNHELADKVVFFLAETHVQLGQFSEAHKRYAEYLRLSPDGKYSRQGRFRVGESLYMDGQHKAARPLLTQFVTKYPDDSLCEYAYPYLGEIALIRSEPEAAQEAFQQGLQKFPTGTLAAECRFGLARSLESLGDSDGAIRFYEFLGGSDQRTAISDDALLQMAILYYQQSRFDDAVAALERQRDRYPGSDLAAHAAYWLGLSETSLGRFSKAEQTLSSGARRAPKHELAPAMLFAAGEACRKLQDQAAAKRHYQSVLDEYSASKWADDSFQTLVQIAWDAADMPEVCELAKRFAELYPDSPGLTYVNQTAARAYLKQANYEQAIALLEPCLEKLMRQTDAPEGTSVEPLEAPLPADVKQVSPRSEAIPATRYYLALALLGAKRHHDALRQLELLEHVQEPSELVAGVHVARATALLGLERHADAIQSLHAYLTSNPQGADAEKCRAQLAVTCARLERWEEVRRVFGQMQRQQTDRPLYLSSLEYLAEAAYNKGHRILAARMFRELSQEGNPEKCIAQGLSGLAWLDWTGEGGSTGSALQFEKLLKRFPDSPLAPEAAMIRGQSLEQDDNPEGALAMYRLVLDRYADSSHASTATLAAARIYDHLQQDGRAEPLLREWLKQHPDSEQRPAALYQLAWVLVDLARQDEADAVFQQIHDLYRSSRYWSDATYRLAERAARAKDSNKASSLADEIIDSASEPQMVAYALYLRGQLAAAAQQWSIAVELLQRLLDEHPNNPHRLAAEYWLAEGHFRQRHYDTAGKLFDELNQRTHDHAEPWVAMIPLRRAQVLAHRRQWDDAFVIAVQIEARFPEFAQLHEVDYLVGRYHASRGEFKEAREAYTRVIRSATGRGTETAAVSQWMIGETYFMQNQFNQAIKAYHRVEAVYDFARWKAGALLQAGKCHEMVGRWSEATELYAKVVDEYAATRFAEKASRRLRVAQQRAELMQR